MKSDYKFVPQKKRSRLRIKLGYIFYCSLRYFYWIKYHFVFARKSEYSAEKIKEMFPYIQAEHSTPLFRNLSKDDIELQYGKVNNLSIALKCITNCILEENKLFSYWHLIGNPTRFRGFKKGMMLVNGKPCAKISGGLCQLSNLIYWMTLHTPLEVVERFRHSYDVFPDANRTQPFGSGATCVYNYRDLVIRNPCKNPFVILIWIENNRLYGEWRTTEPVKDFYEVYQKEHYFTQEITSEYVRHNSIYRRHYVLNEKNEKILVSDDFITENHALMMYSPLLDEKNNF